MGPFRTRSTTLDQAESAYTSFRKQAWSNAVLYCAPQVLIRTGWFQAVPTGFRLVPSGYDQIPSGSDRNPVRTAWNQPVPWYQVPE